VSDLNFSCPRRISAPETELLAAEQLEACVTSIHGLEPSFASPVAEKERTEPCPWSAHPEYDRTIGQQASEPPCDVMPASHGLHVSDVCATEPTYFPGAQGEQAEAEFVAALKKPAGQSWHEALLEVFPTPAHRDLPASHAVTSVQAMQCDAAVAPLPELYLPDGHEMQADSPLCIRALFAASARYFPAPQSMHGELPPAEEYLPAAQTVQSSSGLSWRAASDASCAFTVPAGQEAQSDALPVPALAFPVEQTVQVSDVCPEEDLNFPTEHGMHAATLPASAL
jgi:hypothetical protein